eukprot:m51a1_g6369 hypothetical protein (462) ;mRNA; f:121686-123279
MPIVSLKLRKAGGVPQWLASGSMFSRTLALLLVCCLLWAASSLVLSLGATTPAESPALSDEFSRADWRALAVALALPEGRTRPAPNTSLVQRNFDTFYDDYSRRRVATFGEGRMDDERRNWQRYARIARTTSDPPTPFAGRGDSRGVVFTCGSRYFSLCYANIRMILEVHKARLPVEVWTDVGELIPDQDQRLDNLTKRFPHLRRRYFAEIADDYAAWFGEMHQGASNVGPKNFHMKLMAIMGSRFANVLYLDADNTAARNPEALFDSNEFRDTGAIFWPDMYSVPSWSPIWFVMGVPFREMWAQESGQILVNKTRAWRGLMLAAALNQRQDFFYSVVNGDKDTFLFSWLAIEEPFYFVPHPPVPVGTNWGAFCGNTFGQSDPSGRVTFLHGVGVKGEPHSRLPRKWEALKFYDPEGAAPTYRWLGSCIDVDERRSGAVTVVPFADELGNVEDVLLSLQQE